MDFHEYLIYYAMLATVFYFLYKMVMSIENENKRLKDRNFQLANWLQLAELQTGTAYYSSIAVDAVPGELNKLFSRTLQMRIQNIGVVQPPGYTAPAYEEAPPAQEDEPTHTCTRHARSAGQMHSVRSQHGHLLICLPSMGYSYPIQQAWPVFASLRRPPQAAPAAQLQLPLQTY
jgi:hypothetical protein